MYRMATSADVKPPRGQKFSRYLWKMPVKKVCPSSEPTASPQHGDSSNVSFDIGMQRNGNGSAAIQFEACMVLLQAQRLQKRELTHMRAVDGEDVHMASTRAIKQKNKKRTHGDVEMADAEVRLLRPLCMHPFPLA